MKFLMVVFIVALIINVISNYQLNQLRKTANELAKMNKNILLELKGFSLKRNEDDTDYTKQQLHSIIANLNADIDILLDPNATFGNKADVRLRRDFNKDIDDMMNLAPSPLL